MALCEVQFERPSPAGAWRVFNVEFPVGKPIKVRPDVADYILTKYNGKKEGTVKLVSGKRGKWVKPVLPNVRDWDQAVRLAQVDPDELRAVAPIPADLLKKLGDSKATLEAIAKGEADECLLSTLLFCQLTGAGEEVKAAIKARLGASAPKE